jgi:hypothetical protein
MGQNAFIRAGGEGGQILMRKPVYLWRCCPRLVQGLYTYPLASLAWQIIWQSEHGGG